jgi:hypothetical protein
MPSDVLGGADCRFSTADSTGVTVFNYGPGRGHTVGLCPLFFGGRARCDPQQCARVKISLPSDASRRYLWVGAAGLRLLANAAALFAGAIRHFVTVTRINPG